MARRRVAILLLATADLSGGGGAERQFADVFDAWPERGDATFDCEFVTDDAAFAQLRAIGRLRDERRVVRLSSLGRTGPFQLRSARGIVELAALTMQMVRHLVCERPDVVQIALPSINYVPAMALLRLLPRARRPLIAMTVVDCTIAHYFANPNTPLRTPSAGVHRLWFRLVRPDGVYTWYEAMQRVIAARALVPARSVVRAARYCFTSTERFAPASTKERRIVWAGRLSPQKRPLLFLDVVQEALALCPSLADRWRIEMYGAGELEADVRARLATEPLRGRVTLARVPDMAPVYASSQVYVSTQEFENFTSLAMLEAMAAGNAVVARDVGQTARFVRHGVSGMLATEDTAVGIARALLACIADEDRLDAMQTEGRRIALTEHSVDNFLADIAGFWRALVASGGDVD